MLAVLPPPPPPPRPPPPPAAPPPPPVLAIAFVGFFGFVGLVGVVELAGLVEVVGLVGFVGFVEFVAFAGLAVLSLLPLLNTSPRTLAIAATAEDDVFLGLAAELSPPEEESASFPSFEASAALTSAVVAVGAPAIGSAGTEAGSGAASATGAGSAVGSPANGTAGIGADSGSTSSATGVGSLEAVSGADAVVSETPPEFVVVVSTVSKGDAWTGEVGGGSDSSTVPVSSVLDAVGVGLGEVVGAVVVVGEGAGAGWVATETVVLTSFE